MMTSTNDSNFYVNALLSIKGPHTHFDKCHGLWASCKRLYDNRPLETLTSGWSLRDVAARPRCRVPSAECMRMEIPWHLEGTLWFMTHDVLKDMAARGIEWPAGMKRVRITVFADVSREVVDVFKTMFQGRATRPESICVKISQRVYYTEYHQDLMSEIFKIVKSV